jgi:signal peptidase I
LSGNEKKVPSDFVNEQDVVIKNEQVVININNSILTRYGSSGSMEPILGENANGIAIGPNSPDELNVGDIVTFEKEGNLIVHRIIKKGTDSQGVYFITKGDNNGFDDGKIRFSQIRTVIVAIVY